ncbi:hypothetical protein E2C01_088561 [Portunus trituberculatus]|uniref:Uncharacterized protein n=1 Tax=Portunus trituberculatus TaxID=210409 RepID=A0A5B7JFR8_PORTR|nr:hypothetical protein [Portunus trituberculatus]
MLLINYCTWLPFDRDGYSGPRRSKKRTKAGCESHGNIALQTTQTCPVTAGAARRARGGTPVTKDAFFVQPMRHLVPVSRLVKHRRRLPLPQV